MMIALLSRLTLASALMIAAASAAGAQSSDDLFRGFQSGSNDPINVEADSLDVVENDGERQSTFSGNVTVTRGDTVLKAAKIVIYSPATGNPAGASEAPGGGDFSRIVASGKVYVNSKDQTATGDTGAVDLKKRIITLDGNVTLSQGKNVITGDRLVFDMNTGRARVEQASGGGRIRGIFTPRNGNGG